MNYQHGATRERAHTIAQRLRDAEQTVARLAQQAAELTGTVATLQAEVEHLREQRQEAATDLDRLARKRRALRQAVEQVDGADVRRALWAERYKVGVA